MKKISLITFAIIILYTLNIFAQQIVLTVSDFKVYSDNPSYKYIGKGISRLVAGELRKSDKIILLEREEIKRILEEQEFSLSDLADESKQIQIGKFLSAEYIVFGEIIDMGNILLLSLRMADVETGEIVWQEEITEKIETYDYIGAYFAKSILEGFGEVVEETTVAKIEKKEEKKEEAIVKISEGIDAFDRDDFDTAKEVLEEAKELDPVSAVADYYLAKLVVNTTKFKVITEPYFSYQNPAFLGIMKTDRFHLVSGGNGFSNLLYGGFFNEGGAPVPDYTDKSLREQDFRIFNLGYYFPIGKSMGMGIEAFLSLITDELAEEGKFDGAKSRRLPWGGIISMGFKVNNFISLGLGLSVYGQRDFEEPREDISPVAFGVDIGFLYKNNNESFIYDTRLGYSTGSTDIIDPATVSIERIIQHPLFWENTFTFSFNQKNTFFVIKQLNDISLDRIYYYGRLLPAIENYFVNWFSLRIGVEGAAILLNESINFGYGFLGGITLRVINWGLDIDINFTYRRKPSRVIEGMMRDDLFLMVIFNLNDVFISRE